MTNGDQLAFIELLVDLVVTKRLTNLTFKDGTTVVEIGNNAIVQVDVLPVAAPTPPTPQPDLPIPQRSAVSAPITFKDLMGDDDE